MTTADVGNANIAALTGTLIVRFLAGPACDRWGPRWTYIGILAAGAIPTALSGLVRNVSGLIAIRFFVGVLGGTFVPCQVWSTGFFDKNGMFQLPNRWKTKLTCPSRGLCQRSDRWLG